MLGVSVLLALATPPDLHRKISGAFLRIGAVIGMAGLLSGAFAFNLERWPETGVRFEVRVGMYALPAVLALLFGLVVLLVANGFRVHQGPLAIVGALFCAVFVLQHMVLVAGSGSELRGWCQEHGSGELILRIGFAVANLVQLGTLWMVIGPTLPEVWEAWWSSWGL